MGPLDKLDPLQLHYTELCIEKRRMLNELSELGKQSKALTSDIHRLLDCFMELISCEQYLADDDWSDGEFDEVGAARAVFSEYGFLGDSDEEALIEEEREFFEDLGIAAAAAHSRSPKRKRSRSPRRSHKSANDTLNYILYANSSASMQRPEYPIVVGRALNRIVIHSLGALPGTPPPTSEDSEKSFKWHPRGYESRRKYYDFSEAADPAEVGKSAKRVTYVNRISEDGTFSISVEPFKIELCSGEDGKAVWSEFLTKFGSIKLSETTQKEFSNIEAFFGLESEATRKHLRQFSAPERKQ